MEKNSAFRDKESGKVIGGLILIVVGAALLLRNMGFYLPGWLFSWPMILILAGLYIGVKHNFRNNSWLIISAIGCFFLVSRYIPWLGLEPLFWPIIIIAVGVLFILRPHRRFDETIEAPADLKSWESTAATPLGTTLPAGTPDSNDFLRVRSVFSGINKTIVSKNFQGGQISCVFGGAEIDLSQADISGRVTIKIEMVFGGAKLVVPPHWTVQNEIEGVFHGIEDKRRFHSAMTINTDKVLILKGSAVFGGIEIKSY
jgi:predicted membrane protein